MGSIRRVLTALLAAVAVTALVAGGTAAADTAPRASDEAKAACKNLKEKIKKKKGKAKERAKAKYKKCLEEYDEANPPDDGDGGDGGDTGGGTGTGGDTGGTGGTGGGATQCTSLENCPHLTPDDAAGQQALGGQIFLERAEFGSSGQTAEYYRLFFYSGGVFRGFAVDWNSVSGEICRSGSVAQGTWSFKDGYTYTLNGGGVLVVVNLSANGQSGTELLDFRNGAGSSVYVGPQAIRFDNNPHAADNC